MPTILFMPALYVLRSTTPNKFYIGSAPDLPSRLAEHHRGHSPYTKHPGPWVLIYQEQYSALVEAQRREREVKSWKSHRSIRELIHHVVG